MRAETTLTSYIKVLEELVNKLPSALTTPITRNIDSRLEDPVKYIGEHEPQGSVFIGDQVIRTIEVSRSLCSSVKDFAIIGVDGSSRAIDTPYMFIGIATVSAYSRVLGEILDHPPLPMKYIIPEMNAPFIAISFDFNAESIGLAGLSRYATSISPAGTPYQKDYNKALILDEIRTSLENKMLKHIAQNIARIGEETKLVVFIDGPVYPVPRLFRQHYSLVVKRLPSRGRLDDYVASWKELIRERLESVRALEAKGVPVIGVVKRIETSRILLSTNNFIEILEDAGLWPGDLGNDQALIDYMLREMLTRKAITQPYSTMAIGPVEISPEATYVHNYVDNVPTKKIWYIIIPINKYGSRLYYNVFRVETTSSSERIIEANTLSPLDPVIYDSISAGTTLPLSILFSDKRSKGLSKSLSNIIARVLERAGVPLTYDTIRTIEAYSIGA